jgi:hypothetical protein
MVIFKFVLTCIKLYTYFGLVFVLFDIIYSLSGICILLSSDFRLLVFYLFILYSNTINFENKYFILVHKWVFGL